MLSFCIFSLLLFVRKSLNARILFGRVSPKILHTRFIRYVHEKIKLNNIFRYKNKHAFSFCSIVNRAAKTFCFIGHIIQLFRNGFGDEFNFINCTWFSYGFFNFLFRLITMKYSQGPRRVCKVPS